MRFQIGDTVRPKKDHHMYDKMKKKGDAKVISISNGSRYPVDVIYNNGDTGRWFEASLKLVRRLA